MSSTEIAQGAERSLSGSEKRTLALLGLPTFGLALSITMVSTYLPKAVEQFTSSTTAIGAVVGGEGIMALWVPLVVGPWSDQLSTRLGGRLPFLLAAAPLMAVALVAIGLLGSLQLVALAAAVFFLAYFVAYEPYRALYPDLIDEKGIAGRAQGTQAMWRGAGTGVALLTGGLLLSRARVAPFVLAALVVICTSGGFAWAAWRRGLPDRDPHHGELAIAEHVHRFRELVREHPALRAFLLANALWEMALAALKAFVVLYLNEGLGFSLVTASLIVGGTGLVILGGAALAGKLGDKLGRLLLMQWALLIYGIGFAVPLIVTSKPLLAVTVPAIAFGGGAVMSLAYALLMPLMPDEERGTLTGLYSVSRGLGITIGPVAAGALISLTSHGLFASTKGFQATWFVPCVAVLASLPLLRRVARESDDRAELREA
jgi:MFS family permease